MKKPITLYLVFSFGLAWIVAFWYYFSGTYMLPNASYWLSLCMAMPALAVVITKLITREGWRDITFKPAIAKNWRYLLLGAYAPLLLTIFGAVVYFLIYPADYSGAAWPLLVGDQLIIMVVSLLTAPLINLIPCFGEEFGWRGYLLPKLIERSGMAKAIIFSGLIWGIWHAPMIMAGHNYGVGYAGWPILGILAMCLFCLFIGSLFAYVTVRSGSFWPAVLAHGMLNGSASIAIIFAAAPAELNNFIGPLPVGIIGGSGYIIAGIICFYALVKAKPRPTEADVQQ